METIPLFPLGSVLFPAGRMQLQIFEPRYLDLVSRCLQEQSGFGVVWLREGEEVHRDNTAVDNRLAQMGTYARIIDWDSLPNGLLGITIAGEKKFRLLSSYQQADKLHMAEVAWIDEESVALPEQEFNDLVALLQQLTEHPHLQRLHLDTEIDNAATLGYVLAQFLPIDETHKFELLQQDSALQRLDDLSDLLENYSG